MVHRRKCDPDSPAAIHVHICHIATDAQAVFPVEDRENEHHNLGKRLSSDELSGKLEFVS